MKCLSVLAATLALALASLPAFAGCSDVSIDVCFRPGAESCEEIIVEAISRTHSTLMVQAYSLTPVSIIQAIGDAKKRGVEVRIMLDRENRQRRYTGATYLTNANVSVRIDDAVAIAHNKIIIIDDSLTIGGSYNYTSAAEKKNAENVTFTRSACVAAEFRKNFDSRWKGSTTHAR